MRRKQALIDTGFSSRRVLFSVFLLLMLIFSKYFYLASITSYYTFYLIHHFHVSVQSAQIYLFVFLGAVAVGTFAGGPIGDRIGRKPVIWVLDPGHPALHAAVAVCQSVLDRACCPS